MGIASFGTNVELRKKRVLFEGTDTMYPGMAVCYNQDTIDNINGVDKQARTEGYTTPEGYQNEGKFLRVEKPSTANIPFFAGVVSPTDGSIGKPGPAWVDILCPGQNAIVPVRVTDNMSIGNPIFVVNNDYEISTTGTVAGFCGYAMENVDRSTIEGLCLCKLVDTGFSAVSGSLPVGVAGDILFNNGSAWVALNKGSDDQVLTLASGVPTWATPSAGAGFTYGTYEPVVTWPGTGSLDNVNMDTLSYVVHDDIVHLNGWLSMTHDGTSGEITVSLPFQAAAGGFEVGHIIPMRSYNLLAGNNVFLNVDNGDTASQIRVDASASIGASINAGVVFQFSGFYIRETP